jgi:hypothetical protein
MSADRARRTMPAIYICGDDYGRLQKREDCPDSVHDWPLPDGYGACFAVAEARVAARWSNKRCPACGLYGWIPSLKRPETTNPVHVPHNPTQGRCDGE